MSDAQTAAAAPGPNRPPKIVDIGLDVNDLATMRAFWEATLGYVESRGKESYSYLVDPSGHGPHLFLQVVPEPRTEKNRMHLDVVVPRLYDAVDAAVARGGKRVTEFKTPITWFVVVEDPEGNQFCLVDEGYWEETRPPYWDIRTDEPHVH